MRKTLSWLGGFVCLSTLFTVCYRCVGVVSPFYWTLLCVKNTVGGNFGDSRVPADLTEPEGPAKENWPNWRSEIFTEILNI
jgi:hypothetical protein